VLDDVAAGKLQPAAAERLLHPRQQRDTFESVGGLAKIDTSRTSRTGFPEVVFGEGKTSGQLQAILKAFIVEGRRAAADTAAKSSGHRPPILATKVSEEKWTSLRTAVPGLVYYPTAQIVVYATYATFATAEHERSAAAAESGENAVDIAASASVNTSSEAAPLSPPLGRVAVLCAGTSDLPVAEEAAVLLEVCGAAVERIYDIGVAGIHRLFANMDRVHRCQVAICVAGMDGAMPSVVAGLVRCPVVAVPTSVGYGAAFGGVAALLAMLNACAPCIAVVYIDNGFGGAAMAL
ncbi:unnamed protein product, partial [Phaeothamnion confervicola]